MVRKSLFAALGFAALVGAGIAGGSTEAAAYGCGPWNNWCRPACGPWNGWCAYWRYPGVSLSFGYGPHYWGGYGGGYPHGNGHHGDWNDDHGDWNNDHGGDRYGHDH